MQEGRIIAHATEAEQQRTVEVDAGTTTSVRKASSKLS